MLDELSVRIPPYSTLNHHGRATVFTLSICQAHRARIPSRDDAKEEERRIRREFAGAVVAVKISKNGKGPDATYTCAYTLRETRTEELF